QGAEWRERNMSEKEANGGSLGAIEEDKPDQAKRGNEVEQITDLRHNLAQPQPSKGTIGTQQLHIGQGSHGLDLKVPVLDFCKGQRAKGKGHAHTRLFLPLCSYLFALTVGSPSRTPVA